MVMRCYPHWNSNVAPYHTCAYTYRLPRGKSTSWLYPIKSYRGLRLIHNVKSSSRRKFRSQTSDNMDRWSKGRQTQRRERVSRDRSQRKERVSRDWSQRKERVRRKKIKVCEKVESREKLLFFSLFCRSRGSKVGLLKRWVWSHLEGWEIKNRQKLHTIVARSRFGNQNVESRAPSDHFRTFNRHFYRRRSGFCTFTKFRSTWGFCSTNTMAGMGRLKRIWKYACRHVGNFESWRASRRIALFLMSPPLNLGEKVLQNCCIFDAVNCKHLPFQM